MMLRLMLIFALAFVPAACGTKSNLDLPTGKKPPQGQQDPSKPPHPIGR
jgi:predicted small lipoprotein YifL